MAKTSKSPAKSPKKTPTARKAEVYPEDLIEKACESALEVLNALNLDYQLQSEINWCLGSYRNDRNPVGLYQMAERALAVFREEQLKKTKGVTTKLISDIDKAISKRR